MNVMRASPMLLVVVAACTPPTAAQCGPTNCTGCCDSTGRCVTLTNETTCGSNGFTCQVCGAGQQCSGGSCIGGFIGTGGGSSGTGGGATAGGSSAGGSSAGGSSGGGASGGGASGGGVSGGGASGGGASGGGASGGGASGGGASGGGASGGGASGGVAVPADLLFVVDVSGSMNTPLDPNGATCGGCTGTGCPATCPTRVSALRGALGSFLTMNPTLGRYGAIAFPSPATFTPIGCAPATTEAVALLGSSTPSNPSTLTAQTRSVQTFVAGIGTTTMVTGGTPTAGTLRYAATLTPFSSSARPHGIVLITDGLPNCNPANPLSCSAMPAPSPDLCTIGAGCMGQYCQAGYLDQTATVQAVAALELAGVKTSIVVIGPLTPQVTSVMNAMADEGGATACSVTNPGCLQRFFSANDEASLAQAIGSAVLRASVP